MSEKIAVTLYIDDLMHRQLMAVAAVNGRGLEHEVLSRLERSLTTASIDERIAMVSALPLPHFGSPTDNWRDTVLSEDWVAMYVIDRLNEFYPSRFQTMGDLADATVLEFLRVPKIGRKKINGLLEAVSACELWHRNRGPADPA